MNWGDFDDDDGSRTKRFQGVPLEVRSARCIVQHAAATRSHG